MMMRPVEVLLLNGQQVRSLLSYEMVYNSAEQVFRWGGEGKLLLAPGNALWLDSNHDNMFNSMGAAVYPIDTAGVKWFNMFTKQMPGCPTMYGHVILLNSMQNGAPFALLEGTSVTNMRTAGGHGTVAAKWLSRPESESLAIIGCGSQARFGLQGIARHFSLKRVYLSSAREASMVRFAEEMRQAGFDLEFIPCKSAAEAAHNADIVLSVTSAKKALVSMKDLRPGTTVIGLYSFNDLDPDIASGADKWILGCRQTDNHSILNHAMLKARGIHLPAECVYGDMCEVVSGQKPGRESAEEIIVYTHMGMAGFDVSLAKAVYDRALEQGVGQTFVLDM